MQYKKLTPGQKRIKAWRTRRNALVCKLMAENPLLLSRDALRLAEETMRRKT